MAVYIVTGKLGSGKTLCSVGRIKDYLSQGRLVATNLNIDMCGLAGSPASRATVTRLPDHPTADDLDAIGPGNESYDEEKNGLIVLDECGTWLNTREWQDKSRQTLIDWFLHSRKKGWDLMLIVQDLSLIDKQLRTALCEFVVICRRLDRLSVPIFGPIARFIGFRITMPRVHVATVKYGTSLDAPVSERWIYRGRELYAAYDTKQIFQHDNGIGIHTVLSRYHLQGRYMPPKYAPMVYAALFVLLVLGLFALWRFSPHPVQPVAVAPAKQQPAQQAKPSQQESGPVVMKGYYSIGSNAPKALLQTGQDYAVYDKTPVNDRGASSTVDVDGKLVTFGDIPRKREK